MLGLLSSLALLWVIIYAVNKRRQGKHNRLPLPVYGVSRTQPAKYQIKLRPLHLVIETTAFNLTHDKFSWTLVRNPALKDGLKLFYGFGAVLGIMGMFGGIGTLVWITWKLSYLLLSVPPNGDGLAKRDAVSPPSQGNDLPFHLIVSRSFPSTTHMTAITTGARSHHPSRRPPNPFVLSLHQFMFPRIRARRSRSSVSHFIILHLHQILNLHSQGQCSLGFGGGFVVCFDTFCICFHLLRNHVTTPLYGEVTHSLGRSLPQHPYLRDSLVPWADKVW